MTKQIFYNDKEESFINLKGVLVLKCIVSSSFTRTYTGHAQIKNSSNKQDLFNRAKLDCVFQHFREKGIDISKNYTSDEILSENRDYLVKILDYNIKYLGEKDLIKISRRKRKGKYFTYVTDRRTGKIITYKKWSYERNLDKYE